ncbi:MAG TPA: IS200/IS605 family transposase [Actinomycetes bacterium]|nr:IS200/IS605 family transposase [Actinomycetes bacterium]
MRYNWTNQTVYSAKYHLIWCPKYRRRVLVGGIDQAFEGGHRRGGRRGWCCGHRGRVMPDHVHVLAEVPPTVLRSRSVGLLKGRSSRLLRMELPRARRLPTLWSPSWFVSTVRGVPLAVVRHYVQNQKVASRR